MNNRYGDMFSELFHGFNRRMHEFADYTDRFNRDV